MKVLMFGWEFPPHNSGGLGVACEGLAKSLAGIGVSIDFVLPKRVPISRNYLQFIFADESGGDVAFKDSLLNAYITNEEYKDSLASLSPEERKLCGLNLFEQVKKYAFEANKITKERDFDIIHAHDWLTFGAGINAKRMSGKPLVVHIHATEFDRTGGMGINKNVYEIEKEGFQKADKIIAVSQFTKDNVVKHYGIDPEKIEVVHNGVMQEDLDSKELQQEVAALKLHGYKVVSFLGRITLQKGPDYFVKVAKQITDIYPKKVLFLITGSGDMERQIMKEASYLGLSDKILFTGFLRGAEQQKILQLSDLLVMPSVSEPFGIVPLEALLKDTPVLISKQSGVSEVLHHALKADFWDIEEMANKIIGVLEHPSLGECLAENGKKEAFSMTWDKAAQKCVVLYERLVGGYSFA